MLMKKEKGGIRYLIFVITLYISTLYFSYLSFTGSNFSNEISTDSYITVTLIVDALAIGFVLLNLRRRNRLIFIPLIVPLLLVLLYFFEDGVTTWMFNSFIAFSLPCCYIGTSMGVEKSINKLSKWLELVMLFVTLAVIVSMPYVIFARTRDFEYQTYSYYCGFAYSMNLFYLLNGKDFDRFNFFQNKFYSVVSVILLVIQAGCCLMAGGRGGFVLVIVATVAFLLMSKRVKLGQLIVSAALFMVIVAILPSEFTDSISLGSERTFSFLNGGKIDLEAASDRDKVYNKAINLISERPLLGYGIFGYALYNKATPHNIFLEVMLQGGIVYSLFFWIFMAYIIIKMRKIIKRDRSNRLLLAIGIWPAVELLFSSSYMMFGLFWFLVAYIFVYDPKTISRYNSNTN